MLAVMRETSSKTFFCDAPRYSGSSQRPARISTASGGDRATDWRRAEADGVFRPQFGGLPLRIHARAGSVKCIAGSTHQSLPRKMNAECFRITGSFWSSSQRDAHSLHEIPYCACLKPALAAHFIERFSKPSEVVFDPFMGRGTTPLEAALRGRVAAGADWRNARRAPTRSTIHGRNHRLAPEFRLEKGNRNPARTSRLFPSRNDPKNLSPARGIPRPAGGPNRSRF
jgi:hypothetical protein